MSQIEEVISTSLSTEEDWHSSEEEVFVKFVESICENMIAKAKLVERRPTSPTTPRKTTKSGELNSHIQRRRGVISPVKGGKAKQKK